MEERDLRIPNRNCCDVDRFGKDQRHYFNANHEGFRGEESGRTELRIIANRKIFTGEGSTQERKAEVAESDFAVERGSSLFLYRRSKLVDRDQKRRDHQHKNKNPDADEDDAKFTTHNDLR